MLTGNCHLLGPLRPSEAADLQKEIIATVGSAGSGAGRSIGNPESKVIYDALMWDVQVLPREWRSRCGWTFGMSNVTFDAHPPASWSYCVRCFPQKVIRETSAAANELQVQTVANHPCVDVLESETSVEQVDAPLTKSDTHMSESDDESLARLWWQRCMSNLPKVNCYVPPPS